MNINRSNHDEISSLKESQAVYTLKNCNIWKPEMKFLNSIEAWWVFSMLIISLPSRPLSEQIHFSKMRKLIMNS